MNKPSHIYLHLFCKEGKVVWQYWATSFESNVFAGKVGRSVRTECCKDAGKKSSYFWVVVKPNVFSWCDCEPFCHACVQQPFPSTAVPYLKMGQNNQSFLSSCSLGLLTYWVTSSCLCCSLQQLVLWDTPPAGALAAPEGWKTPFALLLSYCHILLPFSGGDKKQQMWQSLPLVKPYACLQRKRGNYLLLGPSQCKWICPCTTGVWIYLEILSDALWIETFWDHHHPSLDIETQSNLCRSLVVLLANGIQHRILQ